MAEIVPALSAVGFTAVSITHRYDPFGGSNKEKVARKFGVIGINVLAHKPQHPNP